MKNGEKVLGELGSIKNSVDDVKEDVSYIKEDMASIIDTLNRKEDDTDVEKRRLCVKNRAEKYAGKWSENVFLNNFAERDEGAGVNIKLRELYPDEHMPHYIWKSGKKPRTDLKDLLREYTACNDAKRMLLILGHAGIGKSTLITWVTANFKEKKDDYLVYQFAADLNGADWKCDHIFEGILKKLNTGYQELENKVLFLDGFDEIQEDREFILNQICQEIDQMDYLGRFSLIITCRENYVHDLEKLECDYITLQAWDAAQIESFCNIYGMINKRSIPENQIGIMTDDREIFGIPIILYMILALEIDIREKASTAEVYDQIFSLDKNSLYDRCINNARYDATHPISKEEIKLQIHRISQRTAFWMFENNSEKIYISKKEYEIICDNVADEIAGGSEGIKRDFLIGNYFKLTKHCEGMGTEELQFVHRSIYEYFVVVHFYESICKSASGEEVAGKLGILLKCGRLSEQILEFIKYKFDKMGRRDRKSVV